jgi:hypothetical protein
MPKDTPITKQVPASDRTTCEATRQMLEKARLDGVILDLDRAVDMKACPIGVESACCKHCFMGPCRLNPRDPYKKVGICGATIDTIMARNLARNVATGSASHNDHGMHILNLFKGIVEKRSWISPSKTPSNSKPWPSPSALPPKTEPWMRWPRICVTSWRKPLPRWTVKCRS